MYRYGSGMLSLDIWSSCDWTFGLLLCRNHSYIASVDNIIVLLLYILWYSIFSVDIVN